MRGAENRTDNHSPRLGETLFSATLQPMVDSADIRVSLPGEECDSVLPRRKENHTFQIPIQNALIAYPSFARAPESRAKRSLRSRASI